MVPTATPCPLGEAGGLKGWCADGAGPHVDPGEAGGQGHVPPQGLPRTEICL